MDKKRCMSCMKLIDVDARVCPHCGFQEEYYQVEFYHLPIGHTLQDGRYQIGRVIGEGGFGLTYVGWDSKFCQVKAIKEFYSKEMVSRDNTVSYRVRLYKQSDEEKYRQDLKRVEREARTLKQFSDLPEIVKVEDFFEENNTIYLVMEYVEGRTLEQYRQQTGGRIEEVKCLSMFRQLLRSLHSIHKEGVLHRDISLTNIMVRPDESLVLIDFGSARPLDHETMGVTVKLGYAPLEQYMPDKTNQGPWLDVYMICVCLYNCLTGRPLADSKTRDQDDIWADVGTEVKISKRVKEVLRKGLELDHRKRCQSVSELYEGLYGERLEPKPAPDPAPSPKPSDSDKEKEGEKDRKASWKQWMEKDKKKFLIACGTVVMLIVGGGAWWAFKDSSEPVTPTEATTYGEETESETETAAKKEPEIEEWTDQEGDHYIGPRIDGLLEGEGTCRYANGEIYTGQWSKGKPNGEGTWEYVNGNRYEGEVKDGVKEGTGTFYWKDGDRYEGQWAADNIDGEGIKYYADGGRYEGQWAEGYKKGEGIMYYASGNRYEGQWANGEQEGMGTFYWKEGDRYEGQWVDGDREGTGTMYCASGDHYEAQWVDGKLEGPCTYYWKDGSYEECPRVNGIREGASVYYFSEDGEYAGCRREGTYKNDRLEGEATFYWADGTTETEQWKDGEKIK